jgi:hypothetical protein
MAGAPKGNVNALKHGLYAKHFGPEIVPEFKRMPADGILMELAALRYCAMLALEITQSSTDTKEKTAALSVAVHALEAATGAVLRNQILNGNAPVLQDLWDAIHDANADEAIDVTI